MPVCLSVNLPYYHGNLYFLNKINIRRYYSYGVKKIPILVKK